MTRSSGQRNPSINASFNNILNSYSRQLIWNSYGVVLRIR